MRPVQGMERIDTKVGYSKGTRQSDLDWFDAKALKKTSPTGLHNKLR
jgi:hypothetical protein